MVTSKSSSTSVRFPFPFPIGLGFGLSGAGATRRVSRTSGLDFAGVAPVIDRVALGVTGLGLLMLARVSVAGARELPPESAVVAGPAGSPMAGVSPCTKRRVGPVVAGSNAGPGLSYAGALLFAGAFVFAGALTFAGSVVPGLRTGPAGPARAGLPLKSPAAFDACVFLNGLGLGVGVAGSSSEEDSIGGMTLVEFLTG